jgi:hypothetical protein
MNGLRRRHFTPQLLHLCLQITRLGVVLRRQRRSSFEFP